MLTNEKAVKIFYSYAREDEALRNELEKQLSNLKQLGLVTSWHDREIIPGQQWAHEIKSHMSTSQIILLLVSPDYMASDYHFRFEMKQALKMHESGEASVIPIILRPVEYEDAPFSHLQTLPSNAKPVTTWSNRDEAFLDIAQGIRKAIADLQANPPLCYQSPSERIRADIEMGRSLKEALKDYPEFEQFFREMIGALIPRMYEEVDAGRPMNEALGYVYPPLGTLFVEMMKAAMNEFRDKIDSGFPLNEALGVFFPPASNAAKALMKSIGELISYELDAGKPLGTVLRDLHLISDDLYREIANN